MRQYLLLACAVLMAVAVMAGGFWLHIQVIRWACQ